MHPDSASCNSRAGLSHIILTLLSRDNTQYCGARVLARHKTVALLVSENNLYGMRGPLSLCIVVIMYEGSEPCSQTMLCLMPLNIRSQERGNHFIQSARVIKPIWSVTCSFDINLRD